MNKNEAKKYAKVLLNEVETLSYHSLEAYLSRLGWFIVRHNKKDFRQFAQRLHLDFPDSQESFSVRLDNEEHPQIVCILDGVGCTHELELLLHETGHILLEHPLGYLTPEHEAEAELFASYARRYYKRKTYLNYHPVLATAFCTLCLGLLIGGVAVRYINAESAPVQQASAGTSTSLTISLPSVQLPDLPKASSSEAEDTRSEDPISGEVVMTKTGERYHRPDCQYVRGKDNLRSMSLVEARQAGYTPCKVCRPDDLG